MKLRGFKRAYIGRVRLIQQHGEFAEHGARLRHPGDLNAFPNDFDRALLKNQQPAGCRACGEHGLAGPVSHERKGGSFLWKTAISGIRGVGMFGPPSSLRAATRKPTAVYQFLLGGTARQTRPGWYAATCGLNKMGQR